MTRFDDWLKEDAPALFAKYAQKRKERDEARERANRSARAGGSWLQRTRDVTANA